MLALVTVVALVSLTLSQSTPDAVARAQSVLASIAANEFPQVEARFTAEMTAALPSGSLAARWTTLQKQAGAFKGCGTDPRVTAIADKIMVITPCQFERATFDIQFAFDSAGRISGLVFRPSTKGTTPSPVPSYADPSSYSEKETTIGAGEWLLPATLTLPTGNGRVPAVVLVHGSGPHDRDETIGPNRPFRDLAVGLATRGIAVLRFDKRTRVHPGRVVSQPQFTVRQESIEDAVAAVKALRGEPRIDPARVFVLGHSLGGMLTPRIWEADPTIAGLIVMAGPARALEEAIVAQTRYLAGADGTISPEEQKSIDLARSLAAAVRALSPEDANGSRMISGAPASYWLDLRDYDAPTAARRVKTPLLVLHGERDFQVTLPEFESWKAALGSRPDVTFRSYAALNHLLMAGTGPSLPAEYQVPGHVAEEVIRDIATWIATTR